MIPIKDEIPWGVCYSTGRKNENHRWKGSTRHKKSWGIQTHFLLHQAGNRQTPISTHRYWSINPIHRRQWAYHYDFQQTWHGISPHPSQQMPLQAIPLHSLFHIAYPPSSYQSLSLRQQNKCTPEWEVYSWHSYRLPIKYYQKGMAQFLEDNSHVQTATTTISWGFQTIFQI